MKALKVERERFVRDRTAIFLLKETEGEKKTHLTGSMAAHGNQV